MTAVSKTMVGLLLLVALVANACQQQPAAPAPPTQAEIIKRGEYLVTIAVCNDCHTPLKMGPNGPEPDMSRMLSGYPEGVTLPPPPKLPGDPATNWNTLMWNVSAFAGPWGITYPINLTPDQNTGIGIWTEQDFIKTIRNGRHMGGEARPIQPPMPWMWYAKMTDDDLKAVYAYLRSIPPISNRVPDYQPPPGQ